MDSIYSMLTRKLWWIRETITGMTLIRWSLRSQIFGHKKGFSFFMVHARFFFLWSTGNIKYNYIMDSIYSMLTRKAWWIRETITGMGLIRWSLRSQIFGHKKGFSFFMVHARFFYLVVFFSPKRQVQYLSICFSFVLTKLRTAPGHLYGNRVNSWGAKRPNLWQ